MSWTGSLQPSLRCMRMHAGLLLGVARHSKGGCGPLWRRTGATRNALLMVLLAVVALANVAIWVLPDAGGDAPLDKLEQGSR